MKWPFKTIIETLQIVEILRKQPDVEAWRLSHTPQAHYQLVNCQLYFLTLEVCLSPVGFDYRVAAICGDGVAGWILNGV